MILPDKNIAWPQSIRASAAAATLGEIMEAACATFSGRPQRDWIQDVPIAERGRYEDVATRILVLLGDGSDESLDRLERALARPMLERVK